MPNGSTGGRALGAVNGKMRSLRSNITTKQRRVGANSVVIRAQRTQRRDKVGAGEHSSLAQGVDDSREKENTPRNEDEIGEITQSGGEIDNRGGENLDIPL